MLDIYICIVGEYTYRNTGDGSYFIKKVSTEINTDSHHKDMDQIIKAVSKSSV